VIARAVAAEMVPHQSPHASPAREEDVARIIAKITENLPMEMTDDQRRRIGDLLWRYEAVFSTSEFDLGYTDILKHKIDTGNARPIREPLRRHPLPHLEFIDAHVEKMLQAKVIEPSQGEWAANVCLAKKGDTFRFAIDYRRLNNVSKFDCYPIPRIDNCLQTLNGSCWFSTIDLRSSFWQVAQDEADAEKTTFITRKGLFKFRTVAFGLKNASSLFQRIMDLILSGLTYSQVIVYVDDIVLFLEEH
jgi:hypothetical protein